MLSHVRLAPVDNNINPSKVNDMDSSLESKLNQYADWLAQADPESHLVRQFRETWPQRFDELCKFHLSVLIDVPSEFYEEHFLSATGTLHRTPPTQLPPRQPVTDTEDQDSQQQPLKRPIKPWQRLRHAGHHTTEPEVGRVTTGHRHCRNPHSNSIGKPVLHDQIRQNIFKMMDVLDTPEHLSTEGIFRKTGNVVRQRLVRQRILSEKPLHVDALMTTSEPKPWCPAGRIPSTHHLNRRLLVSQTVHAPTSPQINVHDLASGLKGVLYELPEPVLSYRLLPLFTQVAGLTAGRIDDRGNRVKLRPIEERIAAAKQLKALRLLCLLLPEWHRCLFQRLLCLLQHTLDHSAANRMTVESLGTLFGPLLLSPGKVHTRDLHTQYNSLARLATTMIKEGVKGLWMVPRSFAQDVERNMTKLELALRPPHTAVPHVVSDLHCPDSHDGAAGADTLIRTASDDSGLGWTEASQPSSDADSCILSYTARPTELPALVTCINFAVRSKLQTPADTQSPLKSPALGETEYAVAELCATVQALPDNDPRKRRLIQRFNATNGGLTPVANEMGRRGAIGGFLNKQNVIRTPSPGPLPFSRINTGNSAFKAAKTIRSSLRRRLALKSNISIASCFEHQRAFEKPLIESKQERDEPTPVCSEDKENQFGQSKVDEIKSIASPLFECHPLDMEYESCSSLQLSPLRLDLNAPGAATSVTRISLVSTASVSSVGTSGGELFFCCPLVEALASPFRRRIGTGSQHTPDSTRSTSTSTTTPMSRVLRTGRKRLRCLSPPLVGGCAKGLDLSAPAEYVANSMDVTRSSYFPIKFPEIPGDADSEKRTRTQSPVICEPENSPTPARLKLPGLWRMTTQTNLLAFGYRTVSQVRRYRSSSAHEPRLHRSETVPCLKSNAFESSWLQPVRPCESMAVLGQLESGMGLSSE